MKRMLGCLVLLTVLCCTAVLGSAYGEGNGAEAQDSVTYVMSGGQSIELIPVEAALFWEQEKASVRTRIGKTSIEENPVFPGSSVLAGSRVPIGLIQGGDQAVLPMVLLAYTSEADADQIADEIEAVGQTIFLKRGEAEYQPLVAWVTEQYIALVFEEQEDWPAEVPALTLEEAGWIFSF